MPFNGLVISQIQGVTVVSFQNASIIDMPTVQSIGEEIYALVDQQALKKIVLDFEPVRFLSSQMLGVLISLQKKAKTINGRVIICGLRPELHKVFQIMKLEKVLEFAADEAGAMKKFDILGA